MRGYPASIDAGTLSTEVEIQEICLLDLTSPPELPILSLVVMRRHHGKDVEMSTQEMALNLATRSEYVPVSRCKFCDERIAWTASKRTGKRYPCTVVHSQSEENWRDQYRFAPWQPHKCSARA